jgi:undecaprenyl diphosphate synthase
LISQDKSPRHVAIIMDGNGRWAQQRHMPRTVGHAKGASVVRGLVEHCIRNQVKCLTLFAFSTENWQRPAEEVSTLMGLFVQYLEKEMKDLASAGVRLRVIGEVTGFNPELQQRIRAAETFTANNQELTLCVAANYGGRWDMVQAVKRWHANNQGRPIAELTEEGMVDYLSTAGMSDVDLLIRTGGEQRISNFLLWQSAYAELYFTDVLWPDFNESEFDNEHRIRRFGMTNEQILGSSVA